MFEKVKIFRPKRSAFRLSYTNRTTQKIGEVVPSFAKFLMPSDTFRFGQVATVELMPLISPFKGDLYLESVAFFCPLDILAINDEQKFTDILTSVVDTQSAVPIPKWELDKTSLDSNSKMNSTHIGTLWDKFGFPLNLPATISPKITPIAYLQRGYYKIYNEWIRDENSDSEMSLTSNSLVTCCYKKDYFTSVFDSPQHGNAPTLPLSGSASAVWSSELAGTLIGLVKTLIKASTSGNPHSEVPAGTKVIAEGNAQVKAASSSTVSSSATEKKSDLGLEVDQAVLDFLNDNSIDLSDLITFNIDDLRLLNKLQKWLERVQMCGTRTKEFLLANYAIAPTDETLQRPVFLGRLRTPIQVSSNLSSVETATLPQGHKVGNGTGQQSVLFKKWVAKEPGIIYILSFIRPKATYSQGIGREWIMDDVFDFPNPIFQDLGQQAVFAAEIYAQGTNDDLNIVGYQENYVHFKTSQDITTGYLRKGLTNGLDSWVLSRGFNSLPDLTSTNFLHVNPEDYDYLFSVKYLDSQEKVPAPHAVVTYSNVCKAVRPLHKRTIPSL